MGLIRLLREVSNLEKNVMNQSVSFIGVKMEKEYKRTIIEF